MKRRKKNNKIFMIFGISAAIILGIAAGFVVDFASSPKIVEVAGFEPPSQSAALPALPKGEPLPPPLGEGPPVARVATAPNKPVQKKVASLDLSGYIVNSRKMNPDELVPEDNTPKRGTLTPAAVLRTQIPQTGHEPPNRLSIPVESVDLRKIIR